MVGSTAFILESTSRHRGWLSAAFDTVVLLHLPITRHLRVLVNVRVRLSRRLTEVLPRSRDENWQQVTVRPPLPRPNPPRPVNQRTILPSECSNTAASKRKYLTKL